MANCILLADDDASIRFVLSKSLSRAGYEVRATDNPDTLLKWAERGIGDVVLTDVHMGAKDIFDDIPHLRQMRSDLPVIIMSANTSVGTALKSGQHAVFEYIPKPFDLANINAVIARAMQSRETAPPRPTRKRDAARMLGRAPSMQPVFKAISDYMSADIPIYIYGETGAGKNISAQLLHESGARKDLPFVLFDDLVSPEQASQMVENGDLFVDRADDLQPDEQTLLLKILSRNETRSPARRLRVLAAGTRPFNELSDGKHLRADLLYHLSGAQIALPPLSERRTDIPELASFFLSQSAPGNAPQSFTAAALEALQTASWPGNVRQLRGFVRALPLKFSGAEITESIIEAALLQSRLSVDQPLERPERLKNVRPSVRAALQDKLDNPSAPAPYARTLAWIEKPLIEEALAITGGNNLKAAELLGIHRNTLRTKIRALGIER